jgi:hypothetical protein
MSYVVGEDVMTKACVQALVQGKAVSIYKCCPLFPANVTYKPFYAVENELGQAGLTGVVAVIVTVRKAEAWLKKRLKKAAMEGMK